MRQFPKAFRHEPRDAETFPEPHRRRDMHRYRSIIATMIAILGVAVFAASALAGKPSGATLAVSFSTSPSATVQGANVSYGTPYTVSGCGYDASNGGVTVVVQSPDATAFAGQIPDSNGCISLSNFTTQSAGSYVVSAYQQVHANKSSLMASMTFAVG
jgi:hypothetical protein